MAYETRQHFLSGWITNEIIHNPSVNKHLQNMQVEFIEVREGQKDFRCSWGCGYPTCLWRQRSGNAAT